MLSIFSESGSGKLRDSGSLWEEPTAEERSKRENSFHDVDLPLLVIGTKQARH